MKTLINFKISIVTPGENGKLKSLFEAGYWQPNYLEIEEWDNYLEAREKAAFGIRTKALKILNKYKIINWAKVLNKFCYLVEEKSY